MTHHPDVQRMLDLNPGATDDEETRRIINKIVAPSPDFGPVEHEAERYEEIDRPDHYRIEIDGHVFDVIDLIDATDSGFHIGNALKYLIRAGRKPGVEAVTDLRKAAYYAGRMADKLEADNEPF